MPGKRSISRPAPPRRGQDRPGGEEVELVRVRSRGRPRQISREQIVAAALEVGIRDLTMAAVAQRVGATPQSFYRWVSSREELVLLVSEALVESIELPAVVDRRLWREWLEALACNIRDVLLAAPGLAVHSVAHYRSTPAFMRINERTCEVLVDAGFTPLEAQRTYLTFGSLLIGWLAREDAVRELGDGLPAAIEEDLRDGEELPIVRQVAAAAIAEPPEVRWEHMLRTLTHGLPGPVGHDD